MDRFAAAFGAVDVEAIRALMTEDCFFESTGPAPDGERHEGAAAVRKVWERLFGETPSPMFETDAWSCGDNAVLRWSSLGTAAMCAESTSCGSATGRSPRSCPS